jgi:hypothetical protein
VRSAEHALTLGANAQRSKQWPQGARRAVHQAVARTDMM